MLRPTLANFRAQFPSEAMGLCQTDPKVTAYCNESCERLMFDPLCPETGWYGTTVTLNLTATVVNGAAYVTTPREIARLTDIAICQHPIHIRNGWYEFMAYSRGVVPKTCQTAGCGSQFQAIERDNVCTFGTFVGAKTIRVYPTDSRDSGLRVLVQGTDANGQVVLTTDPGTGLSAPGEYIVLQFPFSDSVNLFTPPLSAILKDETFGTIQLFSVDPVLGTETSLSSMEPTEGTASYRRYLINGVPAVNLCCQGVGTIQITAKARLDFLPVQNENDFLTIPNVPALLEEALSLRYSRMESSNSAQQSVIHHQRAIALLNGALDAYEGKWTPSVSVPIFGSNRLHRQLV